MDMFFIIVFALSPAIPLLLCLTAVGEGRTRRDVHIGASRSYFGFKPNDTVKPQVRGLIRDRTKPRRASAAA
jgi:hypothetical protein